MRLARQLTIPALLTTLLTAASVQTAAAGQCPGLPGVLAGPFERDDSRYYLLEDATWENAQLAAETCFGADLVTIDDSAENAWLRANVIEFDGTQRHAWIGYTDRDTEGQYQWMGGTPSGFEAWLPNEPNGGTGENYVAIWRGSANWFDARNNWNESFGAVHGIVEVPVLPIAYNELTDGDGSNAAGTPTDVGDTEPGVNTISGSANATVSLDPFGSGTIISGDTDDVFTFVVPPDQVVTDVRVIISDMDRTFPSGGARVTNASEGIMEASASGNGTIANLITTADGTLSTGTHRIGIQVISSIFLSTTVSFNYQIQITTIEVSTCPCEFSGDFTIDVQDLLAYLALWFASDQRAALDANLGVQVGDLLAFLECWFPAADGASCD